ncbi:MAG TPA: nitrate ABC transporter ATP-binding protein [Elusimicrobia bacterium]|nr:MAG: nitrate ABC transporter ATP-binding protein [Elusimicrobia bacterium GWA2_66_18]OGR70455.1 MAG: nitrate ABC transporter ATP-binding protein [Elusimicrobia bacterium GWC2_65_9]HAZ09238.1 nitrate ABC transporter ATP-binding protein [Elusimicrobiota bacterium]
METLITTPTLCEARGVWQVFPQPNGQPLTVLQDVSLAVRPAEVIALLGPSGCGKSTLLRALAGLTPPVRGEVFYHGRPLTGLNPGVGIVFQSFALFPWMTVSENVSVVLRSLGLSPEEVAKRAEATIKTVGLAGFEGAYPRELSGGMKQRVGIARALSINPEMLFLDEPFSQVDALTAESLRAEVLDIWAARDRNPSSIVMVSHDIKEVVYMADRIVVLAANPGKIRTIVENKLPRPRDYRAPDFLALVDRLHEIITGAEMPDEAVPATTTPEAPAAQTVPVRALNAEPLPNASTSEITGLLEYLDARGGQDNIFRVAAETDQEFGKVITVVKAAELLAFVDTPKQTVVMTERGRAFVKASPAERKAVWRLALLDLRLFREVHDYALRRENRAVDRADVLETIALRVPHENSEKVFKTLVRWARYGKLFDYDENSGLLTVRDLK